MEEGENQIDAGLPISMIAFGSDSMLSIEQKSYAKRNGMKVILAAAFFICMEQFCYSGDVGDIPPENITGCLRTPNGFSWRFGYGIALRDNQVLVRVAIKLIPAGGVTTPELDRVKPLWKAEIEKIWSNQFAVKTATGEIYPIVVDVRFKGAFFHHDVIVRPGGGRSDELNWNIMDSPAVAAHEFGHMIGAYDEYKNGALSPQSKRVDPTSIMTSNPKGGMTYERHYQRFLEWFAARTHLHSLSLVRSESDNEVRHQ